MPPLIPTPVDSAPVWPYSQAALRRDTPNVSFSVSPTADDLAPFDVYEVQPTDAPAADPRTERVEEAHPELVEGIWQQRWTVRDASPEEIAAYGEANRPPADWGSFKRLALTHPGLNQAMAAALPLAPAAALALPAALMRAEQGATADFAGCWRAVVAAADPAPEVIEELVAAAQAANLPAEFVGALQPSTERARDEQGRFVADDPATPENEAWVSVD
jgi:hypothetical protein